MAAAEKITYSLQNKDHNRLNDIQVAGCFSDTHYNLETQTDLKSYTHASTARNRLPSFSPEGFSPRSEFYCRKKSKSTAPHPQHFAARHFVKQGFMFNATIKTKILRQYISMCIIKSCHCTDRDTNPTASTASSLHSSELSFMLIVQIVNALFDLEK